MNHPFFSNIRLLITYIVFWVIIMGVHFSVLYFSQNIPLDIVLIETIFSEIFFAIIGLFIWYVVCFTQTDKKQIFNSIINHVTSSAIVITIWIGACYGIYYLIFEETSYWLPFFQHGFTWKIISGLVFYTLLVMLYYAITYYTSLQEKIKLEAQLKQTIRDAELNILKSQINPHFLFNSLNSISSLTIANPEKAQNMIIMLSDYLRYNVSRHNSDLAPFEAELENSKRYLSIEKVRFGDKLEQSYTIADACLQIMIPVMIMQPLYENAVKHGVYDALQPIHIKTQAWLEQQFLMIVISNNIDPDATPKKGTGQGLKNINDRLRLMYKMEHLIETQKTDLQFTVTLKIPIS